MKPKHSKAWYERKAKLEADAADSIAAGRFPSQILQNDDVCSDDDAGRMKPLPASAKIPAPKTRKKA